MSVSTVGATSSVVGATSSVVGAISRSRSLALLLILILPPHPPQAAEMVVQAEVVDVIPITTNEIAPGCNPPKPSGRADLVELLEWDLRARCASEAAVASQGPYRVYYRWDGRTYSLVMRNPPGDTVPLRVRLD